MYTIPVRSNWVNAHFHSEAMQRICAVYSVNFFWLGLPFFYANDGKKNSTNTLN